MGDRRSRVPNEALRPLTIEDAPAVAALFGRSRAAAMPWLPVLHSAQEDREFFTAEIARSTGWAAVIDDRIAGFVLASPGWVNHLYVDVGSQGLGYGSALLDRALEDAEEDVHLWVFARNRPALAFYRARGFRVVEETAGEGNEEREPDVRMVRNADDGPR